MDATEIKRLIKEDLPDAEITIEDLRGDGDHYSAEIISSFFEGKSRVQQHQIVYQAGLEFQGVHYRRVYMNVEVLGSFQALI